MTFYVYARLKGPCYEGYIYYFTKDNEKQIQKIKVDTWHCQMLIRNKLLKLLQILMAQTWTFVFNISTGPNNIMRIAGSGTRM